VDGRIATIGPVAWRHFYSNRNRDFVLGAVDDKHSMHVDDGLDRNLAQVGNEESEHKLSFAWINQWT
jgi:hypothetical protein